MIFAVVGVLGLIVVCDLVELVVARKSIRMKRSLG
jgi:hypothetical protein